MTKNGLAPGRRELRLPGFKKIEELEKKREENPKRKSVADAILLEEISDSTTERDACLSCAILFCCLTRKSMVISGASSGVSPPLSLPGIRMC